jgi:hypothetical protein
MQTRQSATAVLFLALSLTTAVVQDMTTSSVGTGMNTTQALAGRQLAAWDAPVGHRQPTIVDLPPWLREIDGPGTQGLAPMQEPQALGGDTRRDGPGLTPRTYLDFGVPQICMQCWRSER